MSEFFTFFLKVMVLFVMFWWIGVNFFKHSHDVKMWLEKRRLLKLAEEHKEKVVDMREIFKKEFGFLETAEYVQERIEAIQKSLADKKEEFIHINALEFIFLIDQIETQILKTDRGVYIVSQANIKSLMETQKNDTMYYAKKMREYALQFLPKEGEQIVLNADEVFYWVRNGMLKRPNESEGNRTFHLKSSLNDAVLNLRQDFIDPHYSLAVVSHLDFLKMQERKNIIETQKMSTETEPTKTNTLVEGKMILFSDNTRRMKLKDKDIVIVTSSAGVSWKEDLNGNKLEEKEEGRRHQSNTITKESFAKKIEDEVVKTMKVDKIEAISKVPTLLSSPENQEEKKKTQENIFMPFSAYGEFLKSLGRKSLNSKILSMLVEGAMEEKIFVFEKEVCIEETFFLTTLEELFTPLGKTDFKSTLFLNAGKPKKEILSKLYKMCEKVELLHFKKEHHTSTEILISEESQPRAQNVLFVPKEIVRKINLGKNILAERIAFAEKPTLVFEKKEKPKEVPIKKNELPPEKHAVLSLSKKYEKNHEPILPSSEEEKKLKTNMSKKVFLEKFCVDTALFSESILDVKENDCLQEYFGFRLKEDSADEIEMYFSEKHFKSLIKPFLEKEEVEYTGSTNSLNRFLKHDKKGESGVRYFYTQLDSIAVKARVVMLNIPVDKAEGIKLDVGYAGGYRLSELKNALEDAQKIGDQKLADEIQFLSDNIHAEKMIECKKETNA